MSEVAPPLDADPDAGWERLHPLTPLLRGGRFLVVAVLAIGQQAFRESPGYALALVFVVAVPAALLFGLLSWRAMRFRITATELQVDSGILTKRSRRVPLARLQAVDIVRPFYARPLGLAELRLEVVGGGGDSEAPLAFLGEDEAAVVRARLLDRAAGRAESEPGSAEPPEQVLVVVPTRVLVASTFLGGPTVFVAALLFGAIVTAAIDLRAAGALVFAVGPALLGAGSFIVRRLLGEYGFTVAESVDGLRLRRGLLDTRSQTIPAGRVQGIRIREPLLWRRFGWVGVDIDVAGYGGRDEQGTSSTLLPVAPRALADALVARVLGTTLPPAIAPVPRAAQLLAPLSYRRLHVGLDDTHLITTHGILTTTTDVVPLAKVQSLRLVQGPWQRSLGLSSLHADTAGRRLTGGVAPHREAGEAAELLRELSTRARVARDAADVTMAPAGP